jgi:acetyltransferase-like isoleucine patch superfamily enzyme
MKIYKGANIIKRDGSRLPKNGDCYFGTFIGCPHKIGENTHISSNCSFVGQGYLYIGKNCTIAPNVVIYTSSPILDEQVIGNKYIDGFKIDIDDVTIGDNCFIGAGAIICHGVEICDNVIIGAGTVVLESITEAGAYINKSNKTLKCIKRFRE